MPRRSLPEFQDRFLDTAEVAELIGTSVPNLEADRSKGTFGIPFYKWGRCSVRYRLSEVLAWAEKRRVTPPVRQEQT